MESKIFGIPLVIILLVLFIAILVDLPMALFQRMNQQVMGSMSRELVNHSVQLETLRQAVMTPTPATPSATPEPLKATLKPVYYAPSAVTPTPTK